MKAKKTRKPVSVGVLINKLERSIALACMRGDAVAAEKFRKALTAAINSTDMPSYLG